MTIKIKKIDKNARFPEFSRDGDAGMDIYANESLIILPNHFLAVKTGIAIELPIYYEAQIRPRSGIASNFGITVLNAPGTIDSNYRGEIKVILINHGDKAFHIEKDMRIAQMVVSKYEKIEWEESDVLSTTNRQDKGFGSSGLD